MSTTYLQVRNGHYYLRYRTPADLLGVFPRREIIKTLKTRDLRTAKASSLPYLQGITKTFALLRSGYIDHSQASESLAKLLDIKGRLPSESAVKSSPKANTKASPTLSQVAASFVAEKERGWGAKTKMEAQGVFKLVIDLLGDIPIGTLDRPMVRTLRANLLKLPPNLYKVFPDTHPRDLLERTHSKTMSIATVNKQMSFLASLLAFAVEDGHLTDNTATGMQLRQNRRQCEERKAYEVEEIRRIVKHLPKDQPERYFIPLLCMYQGMRLDEACQLYREDIRKVDGVWCIDINDNDDKKLKNTASRRVIPVHPQMISLGFIGFVEGCSSKRLWGNLQRRATGGYSNAICQWFRRMNRQYITDDPQKTLHSLRHSFADTLKQKGVNKSVVAELMGHSEGSMTFGRYGKRYQPKVLLEAVSMICY